MIRTYPDLIQGSQEWLDARCGMLTASEIKHIVTPTLKMADNEKTKAHVWEIAAQRITKYVEPTYIGDHMLRGINDEILARALYSEKFAPVTECGFITNDAWGFTLGCSPDGLVGDDGMIECKSRLQRFQIEAIVTGHVPADHILQVHTALLVTGRKWIDYVTYSGGLPMIPLRVEPSQEYSDAILKAAAMFEVKVAEKMEQYADQLKVIRNVPTERVVEQEMFV